MLASAWRGLGAVFSGVANWRFFRPAVFLACLSPGVLLGWDAYQGDLGVDPVKTLLHSTGQFALCMLLLSLAATPIRRLFRVNKVQLVRRMVGLFAFFYALLHLSTYLVFDQLCYSVETCDFETIWKDILLRRFIFVGQLAFAILVMLALTSTKGWQRRLGRNWTRLHKLVYLAATAGVVHFIWVQKSDYTEPLKWAVALAILLGIRVWFAARGRVARARTPATA